MNLRRTIADGFFDGFGPAGLFLRYRQPGGPTSVFAIEPEFGPGYFCQAYDVLVESLKAQLPAEFVEWPGQFRPAEVALTPSDYQLLIVVFSNSSLLTVAAAVQETPDDVLHRLRRLCQSVKQRRLGHSGEFAPSETKA